MNLCLNLPYYYTFLQYWMPGLVSVSWLLPLLLGPLPQTPPFTVMCGAPVRPPVGLELVPSPTAGLFPSCPPPAFTWAIWGVGHSHRVLVGS